MFIWQPQRVGLWHAWIILIGVFVLGGCTEQAERGSISTSSVSVSGSGAGLEDVVSVDFGREISSNTVNLSNIYIVQKNSSYLSVIKPFDRLECQFINRISGEPSLSSDKKSIAFVGTRLTCNTEYAVCMTDDILFEGGARFEGGTLSFPARSCAPELRISQASTVLDRSTGVYDFGDIIENQNGSWVNFTVTNIGPDLLTLDDLSITGSGASAFELESLSVNALDANETAQFRIRFLPTADQEYSATLRLESDDPLGDYTFTLNGTGLVDPPPTILSVGSPAANASYVAGAEILITVNFSAPVDVSGNPRLQLETGSTDQWANYLSGSGSMTLLFRYIVQAGDISSDLDYGSTSALSLNGGDIESATNVDAILTLPPPGATGSLGANKSIAIDAVAPQVSSVNSATPDGLFDLGSNIEVRVNFTENVVVSGPLRILLETGSVDRYATFVSGSGSSTLIFNYTVQSDDVSADLDYVSSSSLELNGGSIADSSGNVAILSLPTPGAAGSLGANRALVVDGVIPVVQSVTSSTANGLYALGSSISIQVNFSEAVTVSGLPTLSLETGSTDRTATFSSGSGSSTLTFTYTVQAGDISADLDYNSTTALALAGASISDAAGNNATLTLASPGAADSLGANKSLEIDGVQPTVLDVSSAVANATYGPGSVIDVSIQFSDVVEVSGTPVLTLETGSTDRVASFLSGSTTDTLLFRYTVASGDVSDDLDYQSSSALSLSGGLIRDASGNNALLSLSSPGTSGSLAFNKNLVIDGVSPQVTSVTSSAPNGLYGIGAVIPIQVTFDEVVNVSGNPQLTLETGTTDRVLDFTSGSGSATLTFNYTVQAGDSSADLDYASASALALNGGSILDLQSNAVVLTLFNPSEAGSLGASRDLVIDGDAPLLSTMTPASSGSPLSSLPGSVVVTMDSPILNSSVVDGDLDLMTSTCVGVTATAMHTPGSASITFTLEGEESCAPGSTIVARFTPSSVSDLAGNPGSGGVETRTYELIDTAPEIQSFLPGSSTFGTSFPTLVLTFEEPINPASLTTGDIVLTGSCSGVSVSGIVADPGDAVFNISLSGTGSCADAETIILDFSAANVADLDGDPGTDTVSFTYTRDALGPSFVSSTPALEFSDSLDLVVEFSEPVTNVESTDFGVLDTAPACSVAPSVSAANVLGNLVTLEFLGTCPPGSAMQLGMALMQIEDAYGNAGSVGLVGLYTWAASFMMAGLEAPQSQPLDYELRFDSASDRWSLQWESRGASRQVYFRDPQSLLVSAVDVEQDFLGAIWIVARQSEARVLGFDPSVLKENAELNLRWPSWSLSFEDYLETKSAIMGR
jgi:hypothetical protein